MDRNTLREELRALTTAYEAASRRLVDAIIRLESEAKRRVK
jgi:hypothetical protein